MNQFTGRLSARCWRSDVKSLAVGLIPALLAWILVTPAASNAQPVVKLHRVGMLSLVSPKTFRTLANVNAFFEGLNQLGYMEG